MQPTKPQPRHLVLIFVQDPQYYPHIERHVQALRPHFAQITVLLPVNYAKAPTAGVKYVALGRGLPQGVKGFGQFMLRVARWLLRHSWDLCQAVDPPCLFPAALVAQIKRKPLVYFSMELFQLVPALAHKPRKRRFWYALEKFGIARSDRVLTVNRSVANYLQQLFTVPQISVVRSIPHPPAVAQPVDLRAHFGIAATDLILIYQGALEPGRGLEFACAALQQRPAVHLVVLGLGELSGWVTQRAAVQDNVHFAGAFPFAELMRWAAGADAGLVWIEPIAESYRLSLPGKLFEYVHNSIPVLASPLPEIATVVNHFNVGEVAAGFSEAEFLAAWDQLAAGIRAQKYLNPLQVARQELNWERESQVLVEAYDGL